MEQCVFVLLPVHNRKDVTGVFVRSLLAQKYRNYQLILIDDGSTDGTADMVVSILPGTIVIRGNGNWWWAGSLQQGYKWIRENVHRPDDIVLIANDDMDFAPDYLGNAVQFMKDHPGTVLASQAYSKYTGQLRDKGIVVDWRRMSFEQAADKAQINCLSTRGLFLKVSAFLRIGGFHPILLPHYISDYEFTIRARRKGFVLTTDERVRINMDELTTGIHSIRETSISAFLKRIFSKRAAANPVYMTNFILLACPAWFIPINVLRVWKSFFQQMIESSRHRK